MNDAALLNRSQSHNPAQAFPLAHLMPWAALAVLLAMLAIYFVGAEQGATSLLAGNNIHEFVHDGRHALGFPCH
ncbi:CbtB-domain containing protein [Pseudomonas marginalis]|uniref:CbtB domain-containing protein n=1 Tax=Pseudomonas TaxID=286 RepID=UPI00389ABD78